MSGIHTLHILNKAPTHPRSMECQRALKSGDTLLLTESAVLALATGSTHETGVAVYALAPDVMARGLNECAGDTTLVDFPAMVDLTAQAKNIISW